MKWLPPPLILLAAGLIYAPMVSHDFTILDDTQTISQNADLTPPTSPGLAHLCATSAAGLYVPVTYSVR